MIIADNGRDFQAYVLRTSAAIEIVTAGVVDKYSSLQLRGSCKKMCTGHYAPCSCNNGVNQRTARVKKNMPR